MTTLILGGAGRSGARDLAFPGVHEKMAALGRVAATLLRCSWFQQNFSERFDAGPVRSLTDVIEHLLGRPASPLSAYARRNAESGAWS